MIGMITGSYFRTYVFFVVGTCPILAAGFYLLCIVVAFFLCVVMCSHIPRGTKRVRSRSDWESECKVLER